MNILIKNTQMLRMVNKEEGILVGDVAVSDDKIIGIGEIPEHFNADIVIDGENHLVMPGLVNAHTHMGMSLMRNYADDLPLMTWLSDKIWPIEAQLTAEDVFDGTMLSLTELIRTGCTTFRDMYFFVDGVAKATEKAGLRANLGLGLVGNFDLDYQKIEESKKLHSTWHNQAEGRIKIDIAPHAPYTCPDEYIIKSIEAAKALNARMHIHLSESLFEVESSIKQHGETPIEHMEKLGLFEVSVGAAHCVHLHEKDFDILKRNDVSVLYNPSSNLKLGNGFAKINRLLNEGINVAIGTDGSSSNNNLNMFEEMHLGALVNKGVEGDPTVIPAYKMLEIATINGAKSLGLEKEIGSLEIGKCADLIIIDLNKPHLTPRFDLVAMLVYSVAASDVKTVICNGKIIMKDYIIQTFDENEVIKKANHAAWNLVNRVK